VASPLLERLRQVADPRRVRGLRHPLLVILVQTTCATLVTGNDSVTAIRQWAAQTPQDVLHRRQSRGAADGWPAALTAPMTSAPTSPPTGSRTPLPDSLSGVAADQQPGVGTQGGEVSTHHDIHGHQPIMLRTRNTAPTRFDQVHRGCDKWAALQIALSGICEGSPESTEDQSPTNHRNICGLANAWLENVSRFFKSASSSSPVRSWA
jgi:hypothetical protein